MASERSYVERATKIAVIASTLGAVIFGALHAGREQSLLPALAVLAAAATYAVGRKFPEHTAGVVLAVSYLTPALFLLTVGYRFFYLPLWMAPFAGAMAAATKPEWQYPARFRFPLIAWALAIALTWPIVAIRVLDWNPSVLWAPPSTPSATVHAIPSAVWVSQVALVHLLGLLWIDWLFGRFGRHPVNNVHEVNGVDDVDRDDRVVDRIVGRLDRFEQVIIHPLLVAATLAALVGAYQGFADLRFLSIGSWADIGRASGSLADGNASGALTALWVSVALCFAVRARSRTATMLFALSSVLLLVATWTSGSRTSLLCALVGLAALAHIALSGRANRRRLLVAVGVTIVVLAAAGTAMAPSVRGPLRRVSEVLPGLSPADIRGAAQKLWDREGYGTAATAMIADEPLQGVGVGAYHLMSPDYVFALLNIRIPTDNAQNWFRHQLAELGVLGSVGWIWWSVLLVAAVLTRCRRADSQPSSLAVKYTITGFGLASLLGIPSQNLAIALTVWTFAFWLLLIVEGDGGDGKAKTERHVRRRSIMAALALAVVFAATTAYAGWRELRPPFVAKQLDYLYEYGLYESMQGVSGRTQTSGHAVTVPFAPTSALRLTFWVEHPDADAHPVEVDVWLNGQRIVHGHFPRNVQLTRVVTVPGANKRFVLEARVDRTFASPETRQSEVGLTFEWEFQEPH